VPAQLGRLLRGPPRAARGALTPTGRSLGHPAEVTGGLQNPVPRSCAPTLPTPDQEDLRPMTSPTGPDQNHPPEGGPRGRPTWGAPQQPPAGYEPPPAYNPPPPYNPPAGYDPPPAYNPAGYDPAQSYPGAPAGGRRPGTVTAAGVIGIVWGVLGSLFALVLMLGAFALGVPLVGLVLLLGLALYVGLVVAGVQALQGRSPRLLLLLSYVAIAISVVQLVVSLAASGGNAYNGILGIVIPAVIVFLLKQPRSKEFYASRGIDS
jgi:hypothetical protein